MNSLRPIEIARMEEARNAAAIAELAIDVRPFAGGIAGRSPPGSWSNKVVGAGLNGPTSRDELAELVHWYSGAGIETRVAVCSYVDPSLLRAMAELGFILREFDSVLSRPLDAADEVREANPAPRGLVIERIDPSDADRVREYSIAAISGFLPPGTPIPEHGMATTARMLSLATSHGYAALLDGAIVGAGAMEVRAGICSLFGLSVRPEYRRRGIHQAMMARRMNDGARLGAKLAIIGSGPGMATERNALQLGFQMVYNKALMVKGGKGLRAIGS